MKKIDPELIYEAGEYVKGLIDSRLLKNHLFHSIQHTLDVTRNALTIGTYCGLNEKEMNILQISALFHDAGYTVADENHEGGRKGGCSRSDSNIGY